VPLPSSRPSAPSPIRNPKEPWNGLQNAGIRSGRTSQVIRGYTRGSKSIQPGRNVYSSAGRRSVRR
jgi:hypothetical protein